MSTPKASPDPLSGPAFAPDRKVTDPSTYWNNMANEWLADPKADSSMLITCYYALKTCNPELADRCKNESQHRRKCIK